MGPFLKAMGAPWIAQQMVGTVTPSWDLTLEAGGLTQHVTGGFMKQDPQRYVFGETKQVRMPDGVHDATLRFDDERRLATVLHHPKGVVTTTLVVVNASELHATMAMTPTSGGAALVTARRVFERR